MPKKFLYLFLLLILTVLQAKTLVIDDTDHYRMLPYYQYSAVHDMNDTPEKAKDQHWQASQNDLKVDEDNQAYWIRFIVKNSTPTVKELYLTAERNYVYTLEYYIVKHGSVVYHDKEGFHTRLHNSPFNSSLRTLPLWLEANEEAEVFLKIQNFNRVDIPFELVTKSYIIKYQQSYSLFEGMFFGIIVIMMFYNLILYFLVQFRPYLYYVVYISFVAIYFSAYHGYLHRYTDLDPVWIYMSLGTGAIGFVVSVTHFLKELFLFKKHFPILMEFLILLQAYLVAMVIGLDMSIYWDSFYYAQLFFNLMSSMLPFYALMILYMLYGLVQKKVSQLALVYAIAWTVLGFTGIALMAVHLGLISTESDVDYFFQVAMACEAVLFAIMLAYRIKEIEREKKEHQAKLVHQSRLTAMGEMISNIAHQWRQPLSEINGKVMMLDMLYRQDKLNPQELDRYLSGIEEVTGYLSQTISDFMNFFDNRKELESFYISEVLEQAIRIANISAKQQNTTIVNTFKADSELEGYPSELVQALLIVIYNSIEACQANGTESPTIILEVIDEGDEIILSISDNGGGIPEKIMDSIFDPYFSTKYHNQGTGLGLYILKMIIERNMGGQVTVQNHLSGAKFRLTIQKIVKNQQ